MITADLATLKSWLGVTSSRDDEVLQIALDAANRFVSNEVYAADVATEDVQTATLMIASRLYKRRLSVEGVAGWNDLGVVRIMARDPDVDVLLAHHYDMTKVGLA